MTDCRLSSHTHTPPSPLCTTQSQRLRPIIRHCFGTQSRSPTHAFAAQPSSLIVILALSSAQAKPSSKKARLIS